MRKNRLTALGISIWLILVCALMLLAKSVDLEILFVLWLIGMLIIAELIGSGFSRPRYIARITAFIGIGILLFGVIVIRKIWVIVS